MGAALQATGANITYSCSWPAYLGGNESTKPFAAMIKAGCNSWRNWVDIQCSYGSMAMIIEHWGFYSSALTPFAGPGHWHDPDMLLIGNGCLTEAEEQTQMAIWSIVAAPLIMGNDLRHVPPSSAAILKNPDAIAVDQVHHFPTPLTKAHSSHAPHSYFNVAYLRCPMSPLSH